MAFHMSQIVSVLLVLGRAVTSLRIHYTYLMYAHFSLVWHGLSLASERFESIVLSIWRLIGCLFFCLFICLLACLLGFLASKSSHSSPDHRVSVFVVGCEPAAGCTALLDCDRRTMMAMTLAAGRVPQQHHKQTQRRAARLAPVRAAASEPIQVEYECMVS